METIGRLLAQLHVWIAIAAAVIAASVVMLGALDGARLVRARAWLDRLGVALFAALVLVVLLGPGIVVALGGPADPLHFAWAVVALGAVPLARLVALRRGSTRLGWWMAGGGLLTLGALFLLWQSGV